MLVTHLIIGARVTVKAAIHVLSILHLPQAIDCGGGLVNALGSQLPCRGKNVCLYFYGQTWMGSFCYKTTGTWVRWNSASGVISFSQNSLYSSLNLGGSLCLLNNSGSHPRWDPNTITFLLSGMEMLRCSQSWRCSVVWDASGVAVCWYVPVGARCWHLLCEDANKHSRTG